MASNAGRARQAVVVIDVAGSARPAYVRAGQGPAGRGVIERRARPRRSRMADRAVGGESCRSVTRIGRALKVGLMTTDACRVGQTVVVIDVAGSAGHAHVRAGQRKPG